MIAVPKLLLLVLVVIAVWYGMRWLNRPPAKVVRRRPSAAARGAIEDLVACPQCGAYVAASAPGCRRPGCPQPS